MIKNIESINYQQVTKKILAWFDTHGRKTLPWQQDKTPYRVWVSEIMLQQTQVNTVIPYFLRFMQHFPDIQALAKANLDEVLHLWTGLGYYTRARNLHKAAQYIVMNNQEVFPNSLEKWMELPGIGRSTAGAILAIALAQHATILDGNVKRVLTRYLAIQEWPGSATVTDLLWNVAEKLTPVERVGDYTQAIMDLGATLCIRGKPRCTECPLQKTCGAYITGIAKELPKSKPRKTLPVRHATLLILQQNGCVLLEKRPLTGIWGGLWSLPQLSGTASQQEIMDFCWQYWRGKTTAIEIKTLFRHTFSHFHLDILPVKISLKISKSKIMEDAQQIWYNLHEPQAVGLPAPIKLLLSELQ